jgi:protocatechuate 3,4-dioxygenase beta subunit
MEQTVNRRDLLKSLGLAGFGGLAGTAGIAGLAPHAAATPSAPRLPGMVACTTTDCTLVPSATVGPYYFDANQLRQDITEGRPGTPMVLVVGLVDVATCTPIPNAVVDVWHTDAGGLYSGYNQPGGNTVGMEFMRGIQFTDANGEAAFATVFPGWYPGRTTHIHFKVRFQQASQTASVVSQLFFPQATINTVYATQAPYSTRGLNPTTNASDGTYQGMPNRERATLTVTGDAAGYTASVILGVAGFVVGDEGSAPAEAAPTLGAPFPNPTPSVSTLWLTLPRPAQKVRAAVYDVRGREMAVLHEGPLLAGRHPVEVDASDWPAGTYIVRTDVGYTVLAERLAVIR